MSASYVYSDLNFDPTTGQPLATDLAAIAQSISQILNTQKGERLFNPTFGNSLDDSLFDLLNTTTAFEIKRRLFLDITSQEPRVTVDLPNTKITPNYVTQVFDLYLVLDVKGLSSGGLVFEGQLTRSAA